MPRHDGQLNGPDIPNADGVRTPSTECLYPLELAINLANVSCEAPFVEASWDAQCL